MPHPALTEILSLCIAVEGKAASYYRRLAAAAGDGPLGAFWRTMTGQEVYHLRFWEKLAESNQRGSLRNIFDDPGSVTAELRTLEKGVGLATGGAAASDPQQAILTAFRLEFTMMHPTFTALFLLMEKQTGVVSPAAAYRGHIGSLIHQARKLGLANPNLELVADLMDRQWTVQLDAANRLAEIQDLRSLIPICSYCKNVRNDKGFWQKVETYMEARYPTEFSHGICPDCIRKHFTEYFEDEKEPEHG